jgi:hypothetical protein
VLRDIQSMPTQHELMAQMAGEKAVKQAKACYVQHMKEALVAMPVTLQKLQAHHRPSYEAAREAFEAVAYLHDASVVGFRRQMDEAIAVWGMGCERNTENQCTQATVLKGGSYLECWKQNLDASHTQCAQHAARLFGPHLSLVNVNNDHIWT